MPASAPCLLVQLLGLRLVRLGFGVLAHLVVDVGAAVIGVRLVGRELDRLVGVLERGVSTYPARGRCARDSGNRTRRLGSSSMYLVASSSAGVELARGVARPRAQHVQLGAGRLDVDGLAERGIASCGLPCDIAAGPAASDRPPACLVSCAWAATATDRTQHCACQDTRQRQCTSRHPVGRHGNPLSSFRVRIPARRHYAPKRRLAALLRAPLLLQLGLPLRNRSPCLTS